MPVIPGLKLNKLHKVKPNRDPRTKEKSRFLMFLVVRIFLGVPLYRMERKEKKLSL
jgi:hypothetical protein